MQGVVPIAEEDNNNPLQTQQELKVPSADEVEEIFSIKQLTQQEQIESINQLCIRVQNIDKQELFFGIQVSFFTSIVQYIGCGQTGPELALLELVDILTDIGTPMNLNQNAYETNRLYNEMHYSGLIDKIHELLFQEITQEQEKDGQLPISEKIIKLSRIYF
ncbi:MAG: hypothetical protein EZS28_036224, partial [Streblomastix strix]